MAHVRQYPAPAAPPQPWGLGPVNGGYQGPMGYQPQPPPGSAWPAQPPPPGGPHPPQFPPTGSLPLPQPSPLLSQPHLAQIAQPSHSTAPSSSTSNSNSSISMSSSSQQTSQTDTLEQKRRERDKREKERKEREMRKQRESDMQKKVAAQKHQQLQVPKEPKQSNLLKIPSEFMCRMQFRNNLPDIPFDPKLLVLPLDSQRYTKCISGSTLESTYKHSVFTEPDLGVPINLIDTNLYKIPPGVNPGQLDPEDQALVDASVASAPRKNLGIPNSEKPRVRPKVTWLRKTVYIGHEDDLPQFKQKGVEAAPAAYKLQHAGAHARHQTSLESQIDAVEDTFDAAKRTPVHPTNPSLRPVEILPVFPDFTLWPNTYTEVVFDADPITTLSQERLDTMDADDAQYVRSNAIVRGIKGHPLVAYITPTETRKRAREELTTEDEEYEQVHAFHFDVAKDADLKDNFFFVFTPEAVYYNELATRVKLRKVQSKEEKMQLLSIPRPSSVYVANEDMADETKAERDERYADLLQPASAEEEA